MTRLSAPIFGFGDTKQLPVEDSHTRPEVPNGCLAMTGPSVTVEQGHLPVRGDLAHIKLAGRYFVPHYAVPMQHVVKAAHADLLDAARSDAQTISTLAEGTIFDVLDIAGDWAWGQQGEDGLVGYVALSQREATGQ